MRMNNKASITALMSSFGRAFHTENEEYPVFADYLAKELMTEEEYTSVQNYILGGVQFFEPQFATAEQEPMELLRRIVNVHIAPSPLCRSAYTEQALKTAVLTGTKQYVILGAGMDTFALGLRIADKLITDGRIDKFVEDRYASWNTGIGAEIIAGKASMEDLEKYAVEKGEVTASLSSGRQEMLEDIMNDIMFSL